LGFQNILDCCKEINIKHLLYASSSSVYGGNIKSSFSELDSVDHPVSIYAASKRANELFAHTYSHLYNIPSTGMRFFTVYGPWGRPDMALFLFTKAIIENQPIKIFNEGKMIRDFTYIDDIIEGILKILNNGPPFLHEKNVKTLNKTPWEIYNLGNNKSVSLEKFVNTIELLTEKKPTKIYLDLQPGDMKFTLADISKAQKKLNFNPQTSIKDGLFKFIEWYKSFYNLK
jgi:UDP-glucuronate 4-epimerase